MGEPERPDDASSESSFDVSGLLRRARRLADLSQRELAAATGIAPSTLAAAEAGRRDLPTQALARALLASGLRLAVVDAEGREVAPMSPDAVRDMGGRRFPAHLDPRYSEEDWWHGPERYSRRQPWYTFDRSRPVRDAYRRRDGVPDDHQLPQAGDSPEERKAARGRAIAEQRRRRWLAAGYDPPVPPWVCDCPPGCAELEDDGWGPPRHVEGCPCRCDLH